MNIYKKLHLGTYKYFCVYFSLTFIYLKKVIHSLIYIHIPITLFNQIKIERIEPNKQQLYFLGLHNIPRNLQ